jgi:outer membrane protein TolC
VFGQSLEELFGILERENLSLKRGYQSIAISEINRALSDTWENPTVTLGVNDLLVDDFTARDVEPMQTQAVTLSQILPTNGKLSIQTKLAQFDQTIAKLTYDNDLLKLKSTLATQLYGYTVATRKLLLLEKAIKNSAKIKALHTQHLSIGKMPPHLVERAEIVHQKLLMQQERLKTKKRVAHLFIERLLNTKVSKLAIPLQMNKTFHADTSKHPYLLLLKEKVAYAKERINLEVAHKIPDTKLSLGYFQRQERSDYVSVTLSMPLPIRGREEKKIVVAKRKYDQAMYRYRDMKNLFKKELASYRLEMELALKNYTTIQKALIPSQNYLEALLRKEMFSNEVSSTEILEILNEVISLELNSYEEMKGYFTAYAKLLYYKGGTE